MSLTEFPLPYFEDVVSLYCRYIYKILFPKLNKHKFIVYTLSIIHIIGVICINLTIFIHPKWFPLALTYLLIILFSYNIFKGNCFLTLLSNKYSKNNKTALHIRLTTAIKLLIFYIIILIIGIINPKYTIYNQLRC